MHPSNDRCRGLQPGDTFLCLVEHVVNMYFLFNSTKVIKNFCENKFTLKYYAVLFKKVH